MVLYVGKPRALVHFYLFQIPYPLLAHFPASLYSLHSEKIIKSLRQ